MPARQIGRRKKRRQEVEVEDPRRFLGEIVQDSDEEEDPVLAGIPVLPRILRAPAIPVGGAPQQAVQQQAIPVPVGPLNAVLPAFAGVNLGVANPVGVLRGDVFATSWDKLGYEADIPLKNGGIQLLGNSATITCQARDKRAKGDISRIAKFIKKHFKLGAYLNGRKMSAQRLIRYIVDNLPGRFLITS